MVNRWAAERNYIVAITGTLKENRIVNKINSYEIEVFEKES